ncbi:MAG TPA: hypothetical protein VF469_25435 [Kofleriaceae bacterium]
MDAKIARVQSAQAMEQIARLIACLGAIAGCQCSSESSAPPVSEAYRQDITPPVPEAYRQDIARLCDVVARSGADQLPAGERTLTVATWLAQHLETQDAHDYLIRIQPLTGEPKAAALETEARRVGLASCALAAEWRTDPGH